MPRTGLSLGVLRAASASAASAASSASKASTAASRAKAKVKVPSPANRSARRFAPCAPSRTSPARVASASREAWRKAPGGSLTFGAGQIDLRRGDRPDALAIDREPRHAERGGFAGEGAERGGARPHAFEHDIEAAPGLGRAHPRLALAAEQRDQRLFQLGQARDDARRQHRADLDVDQLMRAGAAIAESEPLFAAAKRKRGAPAAAERHRPHRLHLRLEPARPQGGHDQLALPGEIGARLEMLERAAAANAEMRADRRDAVGARLDHLDQAGAVAAGLDLDCDELARQREGHEERAIGAVGHAVALRAEPRDPDLKLHGARRSGIPRCRCRRESARRSRRRRSSPRPR